ncbi:MAG: hypothetical protein ACFE0Q_02070 [Anaerolineae bacterium]
MLNTIQENIAWRAIPISALLAGTVFLGVNMALNPVLYGVDSLFILRYFSSIVLGNAVLIDADALELSIGVLVHYGLSFLFTFIISVVVHRWGLLVGIIGGALLGLAIYGINFYTMTVFYEWMFALQTPLLLVSHVLFGAVAGGVYELLDTYDEPLFTEEVPA